MYQINFIYLQFNIHNMITYSFKIKTNPTLVRNIENQLNITRLLYNLAKETRDYSYSKGLSLNYYDLQNQLPDLKSEFKFFNEVHSQSLQGVIKRLYLGYEKFFRDLKAGKKTSIPKFAKKKKWNSIQFTHQAVIYKGNSNINISKIGRVKFFKSRDIQGNIKQVHIVRTPKGYELKIVTDYTRPKIDNQDQVGIDLGLTHLLTTSKGLFIPNNRYLEQSLQQLRIENRSLSRKKLKGSNFYKQVNKLKLLHLKIKNQRLDYLHKVTHSLSKYQTVYVEDLNVSQMLENKQLSRHISDAGWRTLLDLLEQKTNVVRVDPSYTSQMCSKCEHISKESRKTQSQFECVNCGHTENADLNASKNILKRGQSLLGVNVDH